MAPRKRQPATRRPAKAAPGASKAKAPRARRAKTRALSLTDAVRRETLASAPLQNPLAAFEPLRRAMVDRQIALLGMAMAWSPARIIVNQQAAFWDGFVNNDKAEPRPRARKPARKTRKR